MAEELFLLRENETAEVLFSEREDSAVKTAVRNLMADLRRACGCCPVKRGLEEGSLENVSVAVMTLDVYEALREDVFAGEKPDVSALYGADGARRWEGYLHQVSKNRLYIIGADRRGAVFGIYDLCGQIGVSPWHFWADVPVKRKERFALPADYRKADWPDVPYRGIFLNDEEELEVWSKLHTKDGTIGPETYGKIFELILRLRGNYIWPAMHVNYFNGNPENARLAQEMGIIVGTSHCDMLLRSNQNEWAPWVVEKGYEGARYDYSLPGRNREIIREYWAESVEMNRDYEVCYTVGMRGIHDSGFVTEGIDRDGSLTGEEKRERKLKLLEQVMMDQRQILKDVLGEERGSRALQTFIPYKEVLDLYDEGLRVPEDVTLIWVDDNFGYMRRYPDEEERKRTGGHGLYYHASYWAHPGMSYLFINSVPLAQTGNELKKCWESGIRKMWVLNVGALKPLEQDMEFFLRYGWEAGKESGETKDAAVFTRNWINRNFSGSFGEEAARLYNEFAQLTNVCKLEHMQSDKFSQTAWGDEGWRRLTALKRIFDRADAIYQKLPKEERDAFFQLFLMKIHASFYVNASFYCGDRSRLCYKRGAFQAADAYLSLSREMDGRKRRMLYHYNREISGGKWNGILTPESFSPPPMALYPAGKPALAISETGLGAVVPTAGIAFWRYGETRKYVEVFNRGRGSAAFGILCPDWLKAERETGNVRTEERIGIAVRAECREAVFAEGRKGCIFVKGERGEVFEIPVRAIKNEVACACGTACFPEADGYVSMPADGYARQTETAEGKWRLVPYLGRGMGNAMEVWCPGKNPGQARWEDFPCLEYRFCSQSSGAFLLEIHRFLTLHPKGQIRLAVVADDMPPVMAESDITDEWRGKWENAVMNDGEKLYAWLPCLAKGSHSLKIYGIDRYTTLSRLVIYTQGFVESNLGPGVFPKDGKAGLAFAPKELFATGEAEEEIYSRTPEEIPPLPMLYADPSFWEINRLYVRSDERQQDRPGARKYQADAEGYKNVFAEFGSGIFVCRDGRLAIEAEYALENSPYAWLTPALPGGDVFWTHTQAETDGGSGMAMMIEGNGRLWEKPDQAPAMHYRISMQRTGKYHIWLLVKFDDHRSDSCAFALDGEVQDVARQFSRGGMFTYSMKQRWNWQAVSDMEFTAGIHTFSILGRKSGLRIDRIYITDGEEWPPVDGEWEVSGRISPDSHAGY